MRVSTNLDFASTEEIGAAAKHLERLGFNNATFSDFDHDAFLPLVAAAGETSQIDLGTVIAVAFARTPMLLAILANDMQVLSKGRFTLGLGTQIKAHITRRFDMPWSHPARRMTEMIQAIHAIWDAWETGEKLNFQGEFYNNTLMTPAFTPPPHNFGRPKIVVAAVGNIMTEAVGESADGLFPHGFSNEKYFREVTLPAVERGLAKSGRTRDNFRIDAPGFIVTAATEEELSVHREKTRRRVSFYGSTPAYRPALAIHGWGDLGDELHALSVSDDPKKWDVMASRVDDEVLNAFAIIEMPESIPAEIQARYGDVVDGCFLQVGDLPDDTMARLVADVAAIERPSST